MIAAAATRVDGDLLRLSPAWTRWAYRILVIGFVAALSYAWFGVVGEYAGGPAVVRAAGPREVCSVVATLPGRFGSDLHPGMPLRLETSGYHGAHQELSIEYVDAQADGSVVLIEASLPACGLEVYHGMSGTARVRVGEERILFALVPGLRSLLEPRP